MSRLFKPSAAITVSQPVEGSFTQLEATTTTVTDLRVRFTVEKNLRRHPNTCTVVVTNLSEKSRALMQNNPLHVLVEAGYEGDNQRLFAGDVLFAQSGREGTDWETQVELADGGRAFRRARTSRSFRRKIKARRAVVNVIKDLGYPVPPEIRDAPELDAEFAAGVTTDGSAQRELTRLLSPFGLEWSIQDGKVQALRKGDTRKELPTIISQDTGMINIPEYGAPDKKGKPPTLYVDTLLYPRITPGMRIELKSNQIRGLFKVERVVHSGDTHGKQWLTSLEATPI